MKKLLQQKSVLVVLAIASLLTVFIACEKSETVGIVSDTTKTTEKNVEQKLTALKLIKNLEDFDNILKTRQTPLNKLSANALTLFKDELVFAKDGKLAGARFFEARQELSKEAYYELWRLFDVDMYEIKANILEQDRAERAGELGSLLKADKEQDYFFYRCDGNATCVLSLTSICLSNCRYR